MILWICAIVNNENESQFYKKLAKIQSIFEYIIRICSSAKLKSQKH